MIVYCLDEKLCIVRQFYLMLGRSFQKFVIQKNDKRRF